MPYAVVADVKARLQRGVLSGYDNADAVIDGYIKEAEALIDARLRAMGFAPPLTDPKDVLTMKGLSIRMALNLLMSDGEASASPTNRAMIVEATLDGIKSGRLALVSQRAGFPLVIGGDAETEAN